MSTSLALIDLVGNNAKATLEVLNHLVSKSKSVNSYPDKFYEKCIEITMKRCIASGFNNFFVNVGPPLAKKNIKGPRNGDIFKTMSNGNQHSM